VAVKRIGQGLCNRGITMGWTAIIDVGQLVGVINEEQLHKKLITCSELLNWETPVNF